ncbi:MAG: SpoIIIAH-like family protein, partial [Clostridia bacterium]|nr:SpoIIIAH-like family protein [Clostridia bacterium]
LIIEGLIKGAGFEDVVLTTTTENINVVVKSSELSTSDVAKIANIVQQQTQKSLDNIKIIPAA